MFLNLIMLFCLYPMVFFLYFIQKFEGVPKQGALFGIRYSKEWLSNEELKTFENEYRRAMNRYLLILSLTPAVTFFIPYTSITLSIWMIWMLVVIIMFMAPYYKGYNKLLALKQERVQQDSSSNVVYAELKHAGMIRRVKWQQFLPPIVVSVLLTAFSFVYFHENNLEIYGVILIILALCSLLFYACAIAMDRMKTKVISSNSDINVNYSRASKNIYKNFWLVSTWLNNVLMIALIIAMAVEATYHIISSLYILASVMIYSFIELFLCIRMIRQQNTLSRQYEKEMDLTYENDEQHWIGGILYYNPHDKRTMISKKVGAGTTLNMATPVGIGIMIFSVLSLLSIPFICVWIILLEFTPISLSIQDDTLVARHLNVDYVIYTGTISELTLEDELPRCSKISGTAMDNIDKGDFRNSVDGRIQMFLNPQNEYYLRIVTGSTIYYMSGDSDEETLEVYHMLTGE